MQLIWLPGIGSAYVIPAGSLLFLISKTNMLEIIEQAKTHKEL
jgi:predicted ATPase